MKKTPVSAAVPNFRWVLITALSVLALAVMALTGCKEKLYIYNWTYYTPDSVLRKFEKEFNCQIVYDTFASNEEFYAKLIAGGANYDIVFPSGDYVSIMIKQDMLQKIDHSKLSNLGNIDPVVLGKTFYDPGMEYSVPYYFGAAGIIVNTERVPSFERSWAIFGRADLAGKMTMMDDMREVLGDALRHLGYSVNTVNPVEIARARDLVNSSWKPNLVKLDAEAFGKGFADGDFWVVQGYPEVVFDEISEEQRDHTLFFIPPQGGPAYIDSMCILNGARHVDLAHQFIDFIHRPDIYAEFTDYFGFPATVNIPARSLKTARSMYEAEDLLNVELKEDMGEHLSLYDEAWLSIRGGE
jgi:spermidine/putrescine transport system substrate-binding protein